MRVVDVCAFYSPSGGGVRTYIEAKLRAAPTFGHELVVVAPGKRNEVLMRRPGAVLATIAAPPLPLDRRYHYFDDERALHRALDEWRPDHVEASSPWSSATMVGRWQGVATRSLVMHSDPLAAYAYRWFGGVADRAAIDRWFDRFWRHLRGLGAMFDLVLSANSQLTGRLQMHGVKGARTLPMGVEAGLFSPARRSPELRACLLRGLGLDAAATLLIGIGRLAPEKRWDMVMRAVGESRRRQPVGLLIVGDGARRRKLDLLAGRLGSVALIPCVADRDELASLVASADALVHGCEAETFCMVAAEARASGIPLIVPNTGAAADHLVAGAGLCYAAAREAALDQAITHFVERGPELQRAAAIRASSVRTMREHFAELFALYERPGNQSEPLPEPAIIRASH
jgi:alpha-1,6-mannosyltransferase